MENVGIYVNVNQGLSSSTSRRMCFFGSTQNPIIPLSIPVKIHKKLKCHAKLTTMIVLGGDGTLC